MTMDADLIVTGVAEALTFRDGGAGLLRDAALAARDGILVWVGHTAELSTAVVPLPGAVHVDGSGQVLLPGLVDSHSHFVYGGDRAAEFALRCQGASYLEIAAAGSGIQATVDATGAMSSETLAVALGLRRAEQLLAQGVTTSEAKSGYGLSVEAELRLLRVIREIGAKSPLEIQPTLLGLHALPRHMPREQFLADVVRDLIPRAAAEGLARQFDAFFETGAFTRSEVERAAAAARERGLGLRLHADQLSACGGAELAAELGAVSADHLEQISGAGIEAIARSGTSAVLAPVATLAAQAGRFAPYRELAEAGVSVALCSNWNPGTAPSENVWLTIGLACLSYRMAPWEALRAFTAGGARVLGQQARLGRLVAGFDADFGLYAASDHRHLASHWGVNHTTQVFKRGTRLYQAPPIRCSA